MRHTDLIILSYHRFVINESDYRFSRTYEQFSHDITKKVYDWITIDDGRSDMIAACEMMRHCNIRAKLFISTELIGHPGYCTWDQLKELSRFHDIESHGNDHRIHPQLSLSEIVNSIHTSCDIIEREIGKRPRYFVAPYNTYNQVMDKIIERANLISLKNRVNILNISK